MKKRPARGFTLVEVMVAVAITAAVILATVRLFTPVSMFIRRNQARQMANLETRSCLETLQRVMANGKVSTLSISTPPTVPSIPFSRAQFSAEDGSSYVVTWSTAPMNSIHLLHTTPAGVLSDKILTTHATKLIFTLDLNDPTRVKVTLELTVPLDSTGAPGSFHTVLLSNRPVLMRAF